MNISNLLKEDQEIAKFIVEESKRQKDGLEMIPSENYVSSAVLEAMGSILTNKYSEGYPHKRYYGGNSIIDEVELLAQSRAKQLFNVEHVNVQPYSGSPANLAVYMATCKPGDTIMGLDLTHGGHLTHGWKVSATGMFYNSVLYHVKKDGRVDIDEVRRLVKEHKPKLIWTGATAYVYQYEFEAFADIAESVQAYYAADIAHTAGLIIAGVHTDPVPFAHIITTTTHKTLRGPRGGMIMVTKKGLKKDPKLAEKIDKAIFPGLQGGPHDHTTAGIAVALKEAQKKEFKNYGRQIVKNAKVLAESLQRNDFTLVGNGTENHMILADFTPLFGPGCGLFVQNAFERSGITVNKNTIPGEQASPFYPSGIRLGTPAITTRGMKEREMEQIGVWMKRIVEEMKGFPFNWRKWSNAVVNKEISPEVRKKMKDECLQQIRQSRELIKIGEEIHSLCQTFPVPGIS